MIIHTISCFRSWIGRAWHLPMILLLLLFTHSARAQTPDTLSAPATSDQFPIGVLLTGEGEDSLWRLDSLVKMLGINSYFELHSVGDGEQFAREGQPFDTFKVSIRDPYYWDTSVNTHYVHIVARPGHNDSSIVNLFTEAVETPEVRVFLPGTAGWTKQYNYSWYYELGGPANTYVPTDNPNEWKIPSNAVTGSGGYVLKLSDSTNINPAGTDPYGTTDPVSFGLDTNHVGAYTYDFVFRLPPSAPLGNLFRLDISVGDTQILSSTIIDAASYAALPIANERINGREVRGDSLATWKSPTGLDQTIPYKRFRISIPASLTRTLHGAPIDIRLFSYGVWPIYPRLIRIRNWIAQQVLSGKCDSLLVAAGKILSNVSPHNSADKSWKFTREMSPLGYRCLAYIHNLFCDNGLPPLNLLQGGPDGLLPRIWRDQCEDKNIGKGQLWYEAGLLGAPGFRFHDDFINTSSPGFSEALYGIYNDNYWAPVPSAIMPDSFNALRHGIHVLGASTFKRNYQDSIIGYASENPGGGLGWEQGMKEYASSCYDDPTGPAVPMRMSPQLLGGHWERPKWRIDSLMSILRWAIENTDTSLFHGVLTTQFGPGDSTNINIWTDNAFSTASGSVAYRADWYSHDMANELTASLIFNPFRSRHPRDTVIMLDSLLDWFWWDGRMPTMTEASFQLWWGITHGLKGYLLNYGSDDGLAQHGIVQPDLTKTQNVVGIPDGYLRYGGVGLDTRVAQFYNQLGPDGQPYTQYEDYHQLPYVDSAGNSRIVKLLPPPNNYAGLFNEVQREMRDDLSPLVKSSLLQQLNLLGSVCWNKKDSTPTYLSKLSVQNVSTKNLSGSSDAISYLDFGIHQLPSDSLARYLSVLNRLLWTDSTGTDQTDTRTITMQVRDSAFNPFYINWPAWEITNKVTGWDTVVGLDSNFSITLGAGRGTMLRIAPSQSDSVGNMTTNVWNNAWHMAYDETGIDTTHVYWMVYERKGKIYANAPKEITEGTSKRRMDSLPEVMIDLSGKAHNPAIAINPDTNGGFGVVYSIDHAGLTGDSTFIIFRFANPHTPRLFGPPDTLESFRITDPYYVATPAISPAKRVNLPPWGMDMPPFWVSWRNPTHGGAITLVDTNGHHSNIKYFSAGSPSNTKFVSLASRVIYPDQPAYWPGHSRCYIAFQESVPGSTPPLIADFGNIYYLEAWQDTLVPNQIDTGRLTRISDGAGSCLYRTPSASTDEIGRITVTWEKVSGQLYDMWYQGSKHVMMRSRGDAFPPIWSDFTEWFISSLDFTYFPWGDTILTLPQDATTAWATLGDLPTPWHDFIRIAWSDNLTGSVSLAHYGFTSTSLLQKWYRHHMVEPSLEPSLSVWEKNWVDLPDAVMFRSTTEHPDSTYAAKITRYDFPLTPVRVDSLLMHTFIASDNYECNFIAIRVGGPPTMAISPTGGPPFSALWQPIDPNPFDPTEPHLHLTWATPSVGTATFSAFVGDSLSYTRFFRVGTFTAGDTAAVQAALNPTHGDFFRASINLRRAVDSSIVLVLDTALLTESGFVTSANLSDSGYGHAIIPVSDSLFLTMDVARGDSTDALTLSHIESYGDPIIEDVLPAPPDTSGGGGLKKAEPRPQAMSTPQPELDVTVHPNPVRGTVRICVADLLGGIQATVDVVNGMGVAVATLYNATPDAELGLCLQLDCSNLPSGTYYADLQTQGMHKAVKFSVAH